jgi:hypothetical protein
LDQIVQAHAGALQRVREPIEHEPCFGGRIRGRLAGCRIEAQVAGEIERVADPHCLTMYPSWETVE